MKNFKEKISIALLGLVYFISSIRYFPEQAAKTALETTIHALSLAPISIGATLVFVSIFAKATGDKIPTDRVIRIFLTFAIGLEFILGLYNYLNINGPT